MKANFFRLFALVVMVSMIVSPVSAKAPTAGDPNTDAGPTTPAQSNSSVTKIGASDTGFYIVRLSSPSLASYTGGISGLQPTSPSATHARKLDVQSTASLAYLKHLDSEQSQFAAQAAKLLGHSMEVAFKYSNVLNAVTVKASQADAQRLAALPGVKAVYPDKLRDMDTDVGPEWIGAGSIWNGDTGSGVATQGEGTIIGEIDSGVNHAHPSFYATGGDGYTHTDPYGAGVYKGVCAPGDPHYDPTFCNDKLIGGYSFYPGVTSPEDLDGHGSHTASTVAGNRHEITLTVGSSTITRTISGVAPHANIIAYKVCSPSCPESSSVAAVNQGIADGVDAFNFSISGGDTPWNDPVDLAFLDATAAGIFVSASAGNSGPTLATVAHSGPWNATVAATTHTRIIANSLDIVSPANPELLGLAAQQGDGPQLSADLTAGIAYDPADLNGCAAFPAGTFTGKIGMVQRGSCTFAIKVGNVSAAGAVAMIVFNNAGGPPTAMSVGGTIPSAMISMDDGLAVKAWIDSSAPVTARLNSAASVTIDPNFADIVASFSSRGPSQYELVKPDLATPGVNILAAYAASGGDPIQYAFLQGTSMAAPHDAGSALLLKALHPDWTPVEIKSALASTAFNGPSLRTSNGIDPATPIDAGSGRVDLSMASTAGLVLDETYANFVAADPSLGGQPRDLNMPSVVNYNCVGMCSWTRTVKSVLPMPATYNATFSTTVPGLNVTVSPASFTIAPGSTQVLDITADVTGAAVDVRDFGELQLTTSAHFPGGTPTNLLSQDFEGATFPPTDWSAFDLDAGGTAWARSTSYNHTPSGVGSAVHNYYTPADQNGWLVTPAIAIPADVSASLNFWERASFPTYYGGHFVYVCNMSNDCSAPPTNYVQLFEAGELPDSNWRQQAGDLSAYAGSSVKLAMVYQGLDADNWYVDDVVVSETAEGLPVAVQHMPVEVVPVSAKVVPMAKIDTTHKSGSLEVPGYQIATPVITLTATVDGLGHAILQDKMVAEDPTNGDPFNGDGGTVVQLVDVPAGALRLVAEIAKSSAGDVDLYVGTGSTPSVATEACVSATGAVLEYCNIDNPEPGPYWILAQNWAASTPGGEDQILLSTGVVVPGDMGNLTVSGPTSVPAAIPFSITLNWNEPALAGEDRWYGAVTLGTSPASPTDIGTTDVDLAYHQPASLAKTAPAVATTGEVIPYTLVLNGLTGNLLGSATITDVLPTGVSFAGNLTSTYGTASYDAGANMVEWSNGLKKDQSGSSQVPASTTPSHPVKLSVESVPAAKSDAVAPAAPAGAVSLALDDGVAENSIGVNDAATSWDFIWFNRFSPASADFPFKMNQVEVFFPSSGNVNVGDAILLALYENKSGSDPSVGTTLKATFPETVQTLGAWNTYTLPSSVAFTGPGDVLVGVIAVQNPPNLYYPASIDTTSSQGRSWIGWWNDVPPTPPTLPSDAVFATIDDLGLPGNWLVRASGETFTVPSVITVTFDVTVTAEGPASVVNTAHLSYDGDQFQAEATTNVVAATLPVTFVYHDLENVVPVGTDVLLSGDFNSWAAYTMTANADYSVFTATLPVEPGTYGYKYRVPGVCGNEYDCLNTTNRRVDAAGEMTVNDYRKVDVGYAHLIGPAAITITVGSPSGVISGDVYIQGVTNPDGMGNYKAQLGYGTGTDLSTWTWVDMTYSTQNGNNDVLTAEVTPAAAGTYRYAVRFNGNWGATNPNSLWAYGDLDGDYPGHDFNIDRTGVLTVLSEPVMFNLYLPVVMKDFPLP